MYVPDRGYAEFETGNLTLSVVEPLKMGMELHLNPNHIALHVDDVAAARAELEGRGVVFEGEILDTGVCHMGFFADPDGNRLMLHHRYAPAAGTEAASAALGCPRRSGPCRALAAAGRRRRPACLVREAPGKVEPPVVRCRGWRGQLRLWCWLHCPCDRGCRWPVGFVAGLAGELGVGGEGAAGGEFVVPHVISIRRGRELLPHAALRAA